MREVPAVALAILASISPFMERAVLFMNQIMLATKKAATSMTQPSRMSELKFSRATMIAATTLAATAESRPQMTVFLRSCRPILPR